MEIDSNSMLALTFNGKQSIKLSTLPRPQILHPTDVIVKVTLCGICGSDLHSYNARETGIANDTVVGHEFAGIVVQIGSEVHELHLGDRVMSPFTTCCGNCFYCQRKATCRCSHHQAHVFGWISEEESLMPVETRRGLHGSQAQFVRVPLADGTLVKVPNAVTDEEAVLLGDILSTAWFCAERGAIEAGDSVLVLGCGPVGLLTIIAARHFGAGQIWAVDSISERLAMAAELGATPLDLKAGGVVEAVKAATEGRGADVVLEVVGSASALKLAFEALRPMGTISSVGVHTYPDFPFSPVDGYNKNLTYRSGRCPARAYIDKLLPIVLSKSYDFTRIITHRMPIEEGEHAYRMFDQKLDGCIKVVLDPWTQTEV